MAPSDAGKSPEAPKGPDAAKPAASPIKTKIKSDAGGDDVPVKKVAAKPMPKFLPHAIWLAALLLGFSQIVAGLYGDRFQLTQVNNSANTSVYRLDRVTGRVHFCSIQQCVELTVKGPAE